MKKASARIRRKVTTKFCREIRTMQQKMTQHHERDDEKKFERSKKK